MLSQQNNHELSEELFHTVCQLAKEQNEVKLTELMNAGINIHGYAGDFSPICWLAKKGEKEAVIFLIKHFNGSVQDAMLGACWGRHINLFLFLFSSMELSLQDIKSGEKSVEIFHLMFKGFHRGGHSKWIGDLLQQATHYPNLLPLVFHFTKNYLSKEDMMYPFFLREEWLLEWYHRSQEYLSLPLTYRKLETLIPEHPNGNTANKLFCLYLTLPRKNDRSESIPLNVTQALLWIQPELHLWFLMGIKKCQDRTIHCDIFLKISSHVFSEELTDIQTLFTKHLHTIPRILYKDAIKRAEKEYDESLSIIDRGKSFFNSFSPCFFKLSPEVEVAQITLQKQIEIAHEKYMKRITL